MRRFLLVGLYLLLVAGVAAADFVFSDAPNTPSVPEAPIEFAPAPEVPAGEAVEILVTAGGDVTFGGNMKDNPRSTIYTRELERRGGDLSYFFANVRDIFAESDLSIVNFEGTLTNHTKRDRNNSFHFRAPPEHVEALVLGNINAVAFENNHTMDYGQQGWEDTVQAFGRAGIVYASDGDMGVFRTKGVSIALLAYQTFNGAYPRLHEQVPRDIAEARAAHDIVIVNYHWGNEMEYLPNNNQIKLGRATIDAGADLVLGHHSHRIQPIERYNGKLIVYSLANFSFSGNTQPRDMDTFLFQQKFIVQDGNLTIGDFRIIPASISSNTGMSGKQSDVNDFAVTPFPEGSHAIERVLSRLQKEGQKLQYAVETYPIEWP